jgi:threonylcarbamoyladenosine tRNA methylthiotransferase MtaB
MSVRETAAHLVDGFEDRARAYVQVQNGCDHRCTFCIIPFGRGNARSVPAGEVISQVTVLAERGHKEVVLTGVDLTSWGKDLPGTPQLGRLVQRILKQVPALHWLRISSIDAIEMDEALLEAMRDPRITPYLHLSLQHGDNLILKRMKRRHTREQAIALVRRLKEIRPDIALGADIIAGFPTETEEAFDNSRRLIEDCQLSFLHVFPYSPRPETPAARMPQLPGEIIRERAARLRSVGDTALGRHLSGHLHTQRQALVERGNMARLADFTRLRLTGQPASPASLVKVQVTGHDGRQLLGNIIS